MDIFRCIISGLLTLCSVVFLKYLSGTALALMWLAAAIIFPSYLMNKFVLGLGGFVGMCGIIAFFNSAYVNAALAVATAVIIVIKYKLMDDEFGYGGYSGGSYSSGGSTDWADRERRWKEEEERLKEEYREADRERRRQAEEENQRRLNEVYEERYRREQKELEERRRRQEAEEMARRRYGCDANTASHWDNDINSRL